MSRVSPYGSIEKRTFESALMHLLETEYGLLGGRRTRSVQLLTDDMLALETHYRTFFRVTTCRRVGSGRNATGNDWSSLSK